MVDIKKILIEVSNRHVHLSREHVEILFGRGYELSEHRKLSQPGQFSTYEKVILAHNNKKITNVRVLGPPRNKTQVEISRSDSFNLGLEVPLKISGDLEESAGIFLIGPMGKVRLERGVIIPHRHLHISDKEAEIIGLKKGQIVSIRVPGIRETIFRNVIVIVDPNYKLSFHIDIDDGHACFHERGNFGELIFD